jgi:hypothetical protein
MIDYRSPESPLRRHINMQTLTANTSINFLLVTALMLLITTSACQQQQPSTGTITNTNVNASVNVNANTPPIVAANANLNANIAVDPKAVINAREPNVTARRMCFRRDARKSNRRYSSKAHSGSGEKRRGSSRRYQHSNRRADHFLDRAGKRYVIQTGKSSTRS